MRIFTLGYTSSDWITVYLAFQVQMNYSLSLHVMMLQCQALKGVKFGSFHLPCLISVKKLYTKILRDPFILLEICGF